MPEISQALYDALVAEFGCSDDLHWDVHSEHMALSNDDATATTEFYDLYACARGSASHATGKHVVKFVPTFGGTVENQEVYLGVAADNWEASVEQSLGPSKPWLICANGSARLNDPAYQEYQTLATFASGEAVRVFINHVLGYMWFDNDDDHYAADREAGTNPHLVFTPGTELWPAFVAYAEPGTPVSATLVPGYSDGSFEAWDS